MEQFKFWRHQQEDIWVAGEEPETERKTSFKEDVEGEGQSGPSDGTQMALGAVKSIPTWQQQAECS